MISYLTPTEKSRKNLAKSTICNVCKRFGKNPNFKSEKISIFCVHCKYTKDKSEIQKACNFFFERLIVI